MAGKGRSMLALLTGMTVGAAAVFLSKKKNRDAITREAKKIVSAVKTTKRVVVSKAKKAVKRGKKVAGKARKTLRRGRAVARKTVRRARKKR